MTITDRTSDLAKYIQGLVKANKTTLGLNDVLYGMHDDIPRGTTVVVMANGKRRELSGVAKPGGRTKNWMEVIIDVHSSKVGDEGTQRYRVDKLAEDIEDLLHVDTQMGGLVIHGFVNNMSNAETYFQDGQFRTVRMTYVGMTETYLSG